MEFSKENLLVAIINAIPHSNQIEKFDFFKPRAICFDWRGTSFRVDIGGSVETVRGACLAKDNEAVLFEKLVKQQLAKKSLKNDEN